MSKMQLLDPIGVACKLILLQFSESGTRLRIRDHVLELVKHDYVESFLWRNWNGESREDMCLLFASIVRFIELYLLPIDKSTNEPNENENETEIEFDIQYDDCSECFKKLASYMITGIPHLEEVYGISCAGLTLQYYINLLSDGINENYSKDKLPKYAQDLTNQNLIQPEKLREIWKSEDIRRITELFDNCFKTKDNNKVMLKSYIVAIQCTLYAKDAEFRKIINEAF